MIQLNNVIFGYNKNMPVLKNITLEEKEPIIAGLWGRNGAGKTTLMKLLAGHERPDHGMIKIMGQTPYNNEQAIQHVCYIQEEQPFGLLWSVKEALQFSKYYNPNWDQSMANKLVKLFSLDLNKKVIKLSKGMKSALQYIIGLSSMADITILDEPTNGLDAGMRKILYETLLESHAENPRLIMVSTHHIEELQSLFETLVVLDNGRMLFYKPIETVRQHGIWLVGDKDGLEKIVSGQKVLQQKRAGMMLKAMIDIPYSGELIKKAQAQGFSVEKAGIQDYLLGLTAREEALV